MAQVLGVPFEVIPFKAPPGAAAPEPKPRYRIYAVPEKREYEITFPHVEGYTQKVTGRIRVNWEAVAPLELDPVIIPPECRILTHNIRARSRRLSRPPRAWTPGRTRP